MVYEDKKYEAALDAVSEDFSDWDIEFHQDHWQFKIPKQKALELIGAVHSVNTKCAEALFLDVLCMEFTDFFEEIVRVVISSAVNTSSPFPKVKQRIDLLFEREDTGPATVSIEAPPVSGQ